MDRSCRRLSTVVPGPQRWMRLGKPSVLTVSLMRNTDVWISSHHAQIELLLSQKRMGLPVDCQVTTSSGQRSTVVDTWPTLRGCTICTVW